MNWKNYETSSIRIWKRAKGLITSSFVAIVSRNGIVTIEADNYLGNGIHFASSINAGKRWAERQAKKWEKRQA